MKTAVPVLALALSLAALSFPAQAECAGQVDLDLPPSDATPAGAHASACPSPDAPAASAGAAGGTCARTPDAPATADYATLCAAAEAEAPAQDDASPAEHPLTAAAAAQACIGNAESEACDEANPPPAERLAPTAVQRAQDCLAGIGGADCNDIGFSPPLGGTVTIRLQQVCASCDRWSVTVTPGWTCTDTRDALWLLATCTPLAGNTGVDFTCRNFQVWGEARATSSASPSQIFSYASCGGKSTYCIASSNENLGACHNKVWTNELPPPLTCYMKASAPAFLTTGTTICYNDP